MGCLVLDKAIRKVSEGEIFEQSPTKKKDRDIGLFRYRYPRE